LFIHETWPPASECNEASSSREKLDGVCQTPRQRPTRKRFWWRERRSCVVALQQGQRPKECIEPEYPHRWGAGKAVKCLIRN